MILGGNKMGKALLVIDMQNVFVGKNHNKMFNYNHEELIFNATKLIDYIPENFKLVEDGVWSQDGNVAVSTSLEDKLLNPGESTVVNVTFEWNISEGTVGSRVNEAKIATYTNKYNAVDLTEDNNDKEELLVAIKTGSEKVMYITIVLGFIAIVGIGTIFSKKIMKK